MNKLLTDPAYTPDFMLDYVTAYLSLKNDAALSVSLKVAPPVISKIRNRKLHVGDSMLVRLHDATGMSIKQLRAIGGISA